MRNEQNVLARQLDQARYVKFTVPDYQLCETD